MTWNPFSSAPNFRKLAFGQLLLHMDGYRISASAPLLLLSVCLSVRCLPAAGSGGCGGACIVLRPVVCRSFLLAPLLGPFCSAPLGADAGTPSCCPCKPQLRALSLAVQPPVCVTVCGCLSCLSCTVLLLAQDLVALSGGRRSCSACGTPIQLA